MSEPVTRTRGRGRTSIADDPWPGWYRPLVLLGLALSLVVALGAYLTSTVRSGPMLETLVVYLVLPLGVIAAIGASRRYGPEWLYVAAALLDVTAVLVASR